MRTESLSDFDRRVGVFRAALARNPDLDLVQFLPPNGDPERHGLLEAFIRVDFEFGWDRGRPRSLTEYRRRFPAIATDPDTWDGLAFVEYRRRRQSGEDVSAGEYFEAGLVDPSRWPAVPLGLADEQATERTAILNTPRPATTPPPLVVTVIPRDLQPASDAPEPAAAASEWVAAKANLPEPGTNFVGFRLVEELGRGAFGRVYLAKQGDLGGRLVALKVACDIFDESQTLAQLQHTNIVPVYSYHQSGRLQAVCMPYFGRTTLAHVVKNLSGRPSLPSSGRELKSTVNLRRQRTVEGPESDARSHTAPATGADGEHHAAPSADGWARLDGLSYVEAVLWLGAGLANGLAHAHDRGIIHRDLKPANVLLTDEGRPMLLDFNLAEDTKLRGTAAAAALGGTLPYMAPEQLDAFRGGSGELDGRVDVYALGVILYELLTGRHPFPSHSVPAREAIPAMIADRRSAPPSVRHWNPSVSPAVEAIVHKCLAPRPADRYERADHLAEDVERQLTDRPLKYAPDESARERARKWARRNPRLTSSTAVAAVAAVLIAGSAAGAVYTREQARTDHARAVFADHRAAFRDAQLVHDDRNQSRPHVEATLARLRDLLDRYAVTDAGAGWQGSAAVRHLSDADRSRLAGEVGETFYMMADLAALQARTADDRPAERADFLRRAASWHDTARRYAGDRLAHALHQQSIDLAELSGNAADADRLRREPAAGPPAPRDLVLLGLRFAQTRQPAEAAKRLREATRRDPEDQSGWFVRGTVYMDLDQPELAADCFTAAIALRKDFAPAWLNRGLAYARLRFTPLALEDFARAVELDPKLPEPYVQRAFLKEGTGDTAGAIDDFGLAVDTGHATPRTYFLRASLRRKLGDEAGAAADVRDGFRGKCEDELSWVARSEVRLDQTDSFAALAGAAAGTPAVRAAALADVDQALSLNPDSADGLQRKAHLLAEHLDRPNDSLAVLDRLVKFHPDSSAAVAGRGVVLARKGNRDEAVRDARAALMLDSKAPNLYQVGCIYALTSAQTPDDRREAYRLLWAALKTGYGLQYVDTDSDLDPLRGEAEFRSLVKNAKALAELTR